MEQSIGRNIDYDTLLNGHNQFVETLNKLQQQSRQKNQNRNHVQNALRDAWTDWVALEDAYYRLSIEDLEDEDYLLEQYEELAKQFTDTVEHLELTGLLDNRNEDTETVTQSPAVQNGNGHVIFLEDKLKASLKGIIDIHGRISQPFTLLINLAPRNAQFDSDYTKYLNYFAPHVDKQKAWFTIMRNGLEEDMANLKQTLNHETHFRHNHNLLAEL